VNFNVKRPLVTPDPDSGPDPLTPTSRRIPLYTEKLYFVKMTNYWFVSLISDDNRKFVILTNVLIILTNVFFILTKID
jgi:hypothetical protein